MCASLTSGSCECVALVEEFEYRRGQHLALRDAQALAHRTGDDIAHHAFDRDHGQFPHQRFGIGQLAHEVRAYSRRLEPTHDVGVELVVDFALLRQLRLLFAVESRRVVAKGQPQQFGIVGRIHRLGLAAIEFLPLFHIGSLVDVPPSKSGILFRDADPVGAQPSAPASAARANSGRLFCRLRCAANMCCRRELSMSRSSPAAASLARCPCRPLMRCLSAAG